MTLNPFTSEILKRAEPMPNNPVPPDIDRKLFFKALSMHLTKNTLAHKNVSLLIIDIRNFKRFNSTFGFPCGDQIIHDTYQRLCQISMHKDCVMRIGNNEFAFILPGLDNPVLAGLAINRILKEMEKPFTWFDMTFKIDIHIGAVAVMGNALSSQAMLLKAENALQKAKLQQLPFFVDSSAENHEEPYNWRMEKDLLDALEQNRLELYYQPKISLKTGKPEHAEALLRWHSPEHGQIPPDQIIPILERAGKMMLLSKWLINTALRQANDWPREQGIIGVAINIPANIIHDRTLRDIVEDAIKIWGIKPELLTLEITESAVIQDQQSSYNNLSHLKQAGIKISIDDFGTGYSSLEYFKSIPADELKIDKSFVLNVLKKVADKNIVQLIIDLAHKFDLNVVAEGIEEKETLELLRTLDCDFAQGYHIARPMSQTKFIAWLNEFSTQN